ncbi:unnamed protein product [Onchocerca ochengi]|uniref:Uncharacterized protein n=1 Tax=Onchocerca ochengi TaxID=42157 RepID=A0A182E196_ONCOC|nr:unnamed protein product [Onchocerca ochengi]VDK64810.1 unnamed protein product [Onchocerca ochengi]VDK66218.1 unnamed protein product [Onchocerca ochengi]
MIPNSDTCHIIWIFFYLPYRCMCCICKSICDLSRNIQGESDTISSFKNSFFQNLPSSKISSIESQTLSDVAQPTIDVKDSLIPMMPNDEKTNPEKSFLTDDKISHPLIVEKLESLPAPVNHFAVDRIFQENNLRRPISGQWTDAWNTPTIPVPSTTLDFDQDYDESRNYLSNNQVSEKNIDTVNISPSESCGNSCSELADSSYNFSEIQTAKPWLVEQDEEFKKPEKQDKENYYDEVEDERNGHIAFSPYSRLKKLQNTFMDIIPKKPCELCDISYIRKKESLEQENEMISFAGKSNFQGTDIMKSKSKLHIADNIDNINFKQVNKSSNSNLRINFLSTAENQKAQNLKKPQLQGHHKTNGPFKKIIFRPLNRNLLRTNPMTKKSKELDQLNISPFSSLKFRKKLGDETTKFLVKSFKLMRVQAPKNNITDAVLSTPVPMKKTSLEDGIIESLTDSIGIQNLTLKSFGKQRNMLDQVAHKFLKLQRKMVNNTVKKAGDLQFSNIRRKPRRKELIDRFLPFIQKPENENMPGKFRNILLFELQRDIWSNISNRSRKSSRKEKLKKLSEVLITPIPIQNTMLNRFIQQHILVKKD